MAIEFSSFIGNIHNSIYSVPILHTILSNVIYTSIVLSIILIILLLVIYPCKSDTPSWVMLKVFTYLVIVNTIVFSVHRSVLSNKYKEESSFKDNENIYNNINKVGGVGIYDEENIKVVPTFSNQNDSCAEQSQSYHHNENKEVTVSDILDDVEQLV